MHIGINIANHRDLLSKRYIHDTARMAEDLGFDSVWIPDHAVVPRAVEARYGPVYYDAVAILGYRAGITGRDDLSHALPLGFRAGRARKSTSAPPARDLSRQPW